MRPGGHLLLLDTRGHFTGSRRYPLIKEAPDGRIGHIAGYSHSLGDYLRAALPHGYVVRACEEVYRDDLTVEPDQMPGPLTPGPPDIWELHPWVHRARHSSSSTWLSHAPSSAMSRANGARSGSLATFDFDVPTATSSWCPRMALIMYSLLGP